MLGLLLYVSYYFSGGLDTKISEIRPIIAQGVVLATVGVFLTAIITGVIIWWFLGMTMASAGIGLLTSLLLASTMASTDSASVFSILRSKGLHLKNNLRPLLELESGSNDPMAYVLVISLIGIIKDRCFFQTIG
jgi:potassium/hydrogen antiporter